MSGWSDQVASTAQLNYSMLEYLVLLPCDVLGHSVFGFLELIDIIQWENAGASHKSQQLLRAILPYCPPTVVILPV